MQAFHAYLSKQQVLVSYSRGTPLQCDTVEFDTTGCFVPWDATTQTGSYFQASRDCIVDFSINCLAATPITGAWFACWLMRNVLPAPDGSTGGECAGFDTTVYQAVPANNVSAAARRILSLQAGDKVWPVCGSNQRGLVVPVGVGAKGFNTCNYFEGVIIE